MSPFQGRWPRALLCTCFLASLVPLGTGAAESGDCAPCHEQLVRTFESTIHGRIGAFETPDGSTGCVTCHGDGAAHMDSGGEAGSIRSLGADTSVVEATDVCMDCHRSHTLNDWAGSVHALSDVGCVDCHTVHATAAVRRAADSPWPAGSSQARVDGALDPGACLGCHREVRAELQYPSHHPVREGKMTCASCHEPHGNSAGLLRSEERPAELCLSCHAHLQGPFAFEHEPVSEGCETCHAPHGSVSNNLLTQNEPFVCLQCHEFHFHAGLEGDEDLEVRIPAYDPDFDPGVARPTYPGGLVPNPFGGAGYKRAFTTKCTQCHTHVHGSDLPSQTVPGGGAGLLR